MSLKRRKFLALLGAVVAVPALPAGATTVTPQIKVLAAAHARKYPFVSVTGISNRIGVPIKQAEAILIDLSRKGLVGPVNACSTGPISAASRVFRPVTPIMRTAKSPDRMAQQSADRPTVKSVRMDIGQNDWLRHLHQLCRARGMVMQPRALQVLT